MKPLQALHSQIGIQLNAKYYVSYLDKEEIEVIHQAVKKKKPPLYQLNLLRLLALKVITELKRSVSFYGEPRWKTAFSDAETALLAHSEDHREMCHALHVADDLIEEAWVTRAVRRNILETVQQRSILSESQERQYEAIRQACLTQNEALTELDEQVYRIKNKFVQTPGRQATPLPVWKMVRRELPSHLLNYRVGASKIHLSETNIDRLIRAEKGARSVYQDLAARLMKKPKADSIGEEIQATKVFLKDKAKMILDNAGQLHRAILEDTQQAIEHRTQVKLAHAKKSECLLLELEKIIQLLQSHFLKDKSDSKNPASPLSFLLTEAKSMQTMLEDSPQTIESAILEKKLLSLDAHRKIFSQSTISGWSAFFSSRQAVRRQRQQQLNTTLQSIIAGMVTPLYGFNASAAVITPEQVKQQHLTARHLDEKQDHVVLEREKIEKIKNTFVR